MESVMWSNLYSPAVSRSSLPCYPLVLLSAMLLVALSGCGASTAGAEPPALVPDVSVPEGTTYWPVTLEATEGQVEVYQPQPESMKGDMLTARAAVSLTRPGAAAPT